MDILMDKVWQMLSSEKKTTMPVRLYRLICLTVFSLCFFIVLPSNLILSSNLPQIINYVTILLGCFSIFCYWLSLRGLHLMKTLIILGTCLLGPCWFFNGGMSGSVTFYYFIVALIPMVLCRRKERSLLLAFIASNVAIVAVLQYYFPNWVIPYDSLRDQIGDFIPSTLECFIGLALILWVVTTSYDREAAAERVASAQLTKSERDYRGVVENVSCIILRLTPDGTVSFFNKYAETLFGCQREEVLGKPLGQTVLGSLSDEAREALLLRFFTATGGAIEEVELTNKSGKRVWISWASQVIYNNDQLTEVLCVGTDVTERHNHSSEMQHVQRLESLGVLAGGIAHDYNNLLTAIMGYVSLTKMVAKSAEIVEYMKSAENATLHARALTAQLLTFAKGGQPIKEITSLEKLLRDSVGLSLHGKKCKCIVDIAPDLCWVEGDVAQLNQVFNNLLINAWQAMPNGGSINMKAVNKDNQTVVTITDTGCGIPDKALPHIFDPYFTTKKTGTGLGLAVVYSIVKHHNGTITVESKEGVGTTFTVTLPATQRKQETVITIEDQKPTSTMHKRILIMDDEIYIRELAAIILKRADYQTATVADGTEVIRKYQEAQAANQPYDLVIMDLTIPGGMGGMEAINELRKIDPNINAVVSSGYSNDMGDIMDKGFKGVIQKPYTADQLIKSVAQFTQN